ncbi:MAG: heparinase II/III family protein [Verrucomicrobia bacterium]|nr:heparinase II/III family protein [Verrucomicrobiota bacterium]
MRFSLSRWCAVALVSLATGVVHARDPWFPDGPVQPQIPHGMPLPQKVRTPQFPLKTSRTLHSDAEIARARANVAQYPSAQAVAAQVMKEAAYWSAWSDQDLHDLVTTAEVPRAVELSNQGCPIHGRKIYEGANGSSFPWIVDPRQPFKVRCPIGGEVYPDNDYGAYYRSGFRDRSSLTGRIVDDGWGWVAPNGERYWFVAHANHLVLQGPGLDSRCVVSGTLALSRAYLLTGDRAYAHHAAVLLHRLAEVYPTMNYEQQSRFGQLMGAQGTRYTGKMVNLIWESYQVAPSLSEAYDNIWETLDGDKELQRFCHQTGEQIRATIEANYLEEAIDAYFDDKMRGNYGTHQRALLQLAVVRQHGDNARYVAEVLHRPEGHLLRIGFDYALYNLVNRDGLPHESPDYNFVWTRILATSAELLGKLGYDLATLPRLHRMFNAPLDQITIGRLTPPLGDSTTRFAPLIGRDSLTYQRGLKLYGDPRFASYLAGIGATGDQTFGSFDALFDPPLPAGNQPEGGRVVPPQPSRVFSGYGYALLNNPADTRSVGIFYGLHVAHYHHDRLHFDLFAHGQDLMPDLGYPDGANEFNPGIFTWSKTSISHNTVTVDAHRQPANPAGHLRLLADGPFARALTADGDGTYPQTTTYRRTLVMVDALGAADEGYIVDFFDVAGGRQHDYSLHGPTGAFTLLQSAWSDPAPGTLAGPEVAVGALYDDPERGAKGFAGSYLNYAGSGFQHLVGVRHLVTGAETFVAEYAHEKDPAARLRLRILPQDGQDLITAAARVSPMKFPELVHYVIARRVAAAGAPRLTSAFVAVLEPFSNRPFLASARRQDLTNGSVVVAEHLDGTRDVVIHHQGADTALYANADSLPIATDAEVAVVVFDARHQPQRAFFAGGGFLQLGSRRLTAAAFRGTITRVSPATGELRVRATAGSTLPAPATLPGRILEISNPLRETVQTITAARQDGDELVLTVKDDLRVGLVHVAAAEGTRISTKTALHLAPNYRGVTLCDRADHPLATVAEVSGGVVQLTTPPAAMPRPGEDVWLVDAAAGEVVRLPAVLSWRQPD